MSLRRLKYLSGKIDLEISESICNISNTQSYIESNMKETKLKLWWFHLGGPWMYTDRVRSTLDRDRGRGMHGLQMEGPSRRDESTIMPESPRIQKRCIVRS